jgi:glycosyltransferase involved in cell wall biosynthesis
MADGQPGTVLHLVPSAVARGAQVYARALVDVLDAPTSRHRLVALFGGPTGVMVDASLDLGGGAGPRRGFDPLAAVQLRRFCKRFDDSVLVAHGGDSLKYAVAAARARTPLVYLAIGTISESARHGPRRSLWRLLVQRADQVVAVSDDVAAECANVLRLPSTKVRVIPNGRDTAKFHPGPPLGRETPVIAFVGRLTPGKRPGVFIDLARELRAGGASLRALLVGDGPLSLELERSARQAGVEMLGERSNVDDVFREIDVLVFPSLPEGEGMPGVLIEAGLSGVPVVATDVPGTSSVVEDGVTGWIVGVGDFKALVHRTAQLLSDPVLRRTMGDAARRRCTADYSLTASAPHWLRLFQEIGRAGGLDWAQSHST